MPDDSRGLNDEPVRARRSTEVEYGELPELTRALRALGSPRRSGGSMQLQFFSSLLDARKTAAAATDADAAVRAFDATTLAHALDQSIEGIIAGWPDARPSARRALRAELLERSQGYARALDDLDERAAELMAATDDDRLEAWRAWTTQLAATFDAADRAWMSVRSIVDSLPPRNPDTFTRQ